MFLYVSLILHIPYILYLLYSNPSPLELYEKLKDRWYGKKMYSCILGIYSPYTMTINPVVECYTCNHCKVSIDEAWGIKNPFNSVHAMALGNLGEFTSGLLMIEYLNNLSKIKKEAHFKGSIIKIEMEYYKKASGKLSAVCNLENRCKNNIYTDIINTFCTDIINTSGETVCKVTSYWDIKEKSI